jgi:hypothetical protein
LAVLESIIVMNLEFITIINGDINLTVSGN